MTEQDARALLLVRAFESGPAEPWRDGDAAWADAEAARIEGAAASPTAIAVRRSRLIAERLVARAPALQDALRSSASAATAAAVGVAVLFGLAADSIGSGGRIHVLAPPLVALIAWNLAVYTLLVLRALRPGGDRDEVGGGALRRRVQGAWTAWAGRRGGSAPPLGRFAIDWAQQGRALHAARIATALLAAAAALACGVLVSMYARGLVFDFRAGWDSTFLDPADVERIVALLLGPAAAMTATPLPDAAALEAMRFASGGGAGARIWIHWWALTVGGLVIVPRALLATRAACRARTLARDLPIEISADERRRAARAGSAAPLAVHVLPYGMAFTPQQRDAIEPALAPFVDGRLRVTVSAPLPIGAEDDPQSWRIDPAPDVAVLLFALVATPERETHGAFIDAALRCHGAAACRVVVDESAFVERFTGKVREQRRAERRDAWRALVAASGLEALFVDLGAGARGAGGG